MKKQLTGLLALLAGLTCLAGCLDDKKGDSSSNQGSDSSVVTPAYDLDAAKNAIYGKYPTKDEGRENYELPNSYEVDGVVYTLVWSTNATENVVLDRGTDTTYVDVNTGLAADFEYNLVAQVSAPDGTSINVPFKRTLKAAPTAVLSPITAAPVADQAYKLHMYQALKKNDLFFTGKMSGFYLATTNASNGETFEDGVDVYAVPVDGKEGVFNLRFTYEDKVQYIGLTNTYNNGSWHDNTILAESTVVAENANQTFEFTYNADYGTVVATLENVKSGKDANATEGTTETFFLGTSNTYYTFGAMNVDEINNANTYVGKLVMMLDKANIAAEDKVAHTKQEIGVESIFAGDNVVRLMDQGDRYPEASITWAITTDSSNIVLSGAKLTTTAVETTQNATLTATITCGDVTDTVSFEIKLVKVLNSAAEIVDAAYALANGEALPIAYELTGKITTVKTPYDSGYKNVTVIIEVEGKEDKPITCYRLKGEGADLIKVGDTITVSGILKNYNDTIEFDAGCALLSYVVGEEGGNEGGNEGGEEGGDVEKPESAEEILKALYALADGESLTGPFTITGKITALDNYSNPTIVVEGFENMPVYCYKLVVSNAVGDTITVTAGSMKNYQGKYEFMDCTLVSSEAGGGEEGGEGETTLTTTPIATIIASENAKYQAEGTVVGIYARGFILQDSTASILVYLNAVPNVALGDKVTVVGTSGSYNGGAQFGDDTKVTVNSNGAVSAATATVMDGAACDAALALANVDITYVSITGTLNVTTNSKGGFYYNVTISGASTAVGSIAYPSEAHAAILAELNGKDITVEGYFFSISKSNNAPKFINILMTNAKEVENGGEVTPPEGGEEGGETPVVPHEHSGYEADYKCDECSAVVEPEADTALTVAQAIELAKALGANNFSTNKYYLTVTIESVYNTEYGNANVTDENGDKYVIYGMYQDGTRYDKLTYKPVKGDKLTVYAAVGSYQKNETSSITYQMKNVDLEEIVAHTHDYQAVVTEPTCTADGYTTHTCSICADTYKDSEVAALGHTTDNGTCGNCGQEISAENPGLTEKSYSYTMAKGDFSANGTKALNGVNWTVSGDGGYWGFDSSSGRGLQFGSKKLPYTALTVKSESFSNVSKITINTAGASNTNAKCVVYVGETKVGEITLTSTATDYTIELSEALSGEVKFEYTQSSTAAIYLKSIAVDYAE